MRALARRKGIKMNKILVVDDEKEILRQKVLMKQQDLSLFCPLITNKYDDVKKILRNK